MGAYRCAKHGLQAPQAGCPHFFAAVDDARPLEVGIRWSKWGVPYLLCRSCQTLVDLERGTADPSIRIDTGLEFPGARCNRHVLEWCEASAADPELLAWMRVRFLDDEG